MQFTRFFKQSQFEQHMLRPTLWKESIYGHWNFYILSSGCHSAEIGKATWKIKAQLKPECLAEVWHPSTIPPVFLLITTMLCLKTHLTSLHCVSQYQMRPTHTTTHIWSEASWKNMTFNDPIQKPEWGPFFKVHRKDEAIFYLMLEAVCGFNVLHWSIDFGYKSFKYLVILCKPSGKPQRTDTWLDVTKCSPHKTNSTILQKGQA